MQIIHYNIFIFHVNFAISEFIYVCCMVTMTTDKHHTLIQHKGGAQFQFTAFDGGGGKNIVPDSRGGRQILSVHNFHICTGTSPPENNDQWTNSSSDFSLFYWESLKN